MLIADLLEDEGVQVIAVLPGRFHPFHKGHASMYQALVSRFGRDNVWVATSNKTELPKSPFTFSEKLQMMRLAGIPADKVVETKNPYQVPELTYSMDPAKTIIVFGVSQKDMDEDPRFSFKPKKDGSPAYLQPLPSDIKQAKTMDQHGYITTVPTLDFKVLGKPMRSATEVRAMYGQADDETRQAIIKDLFGAYNNEVKSIMDNKLGNNVKTEDAPPGMEQWIKDRKPEFKKRYGDKWEEVLYATAWKQHNAKNESINESADDVADKVSDYVLRTTGTGTTNAKGQKMIYTDDVELEEDWKKTLGAAALAITTATAPMAAQALDWSDIFSPAVSAEINQEIKNQLRGYDASSQNATYQGTHQKQQAPDASRFNNTTLQDQPTVDRTSESRLSGLVSAKTNEGIIGDALHKTEVWLKMKKFVRWYLDWRRSNPGQGAAGVKQAAKILGLRPREYEHIINYLNKQVEKGALPKHLAITEESDYDAKMKALQDIMLDPHTAKDPELKAELAKRLKRLQQTKEAKDPCWDGYKQIGMKKKGGKEVPNCVPVNENEITIEDADEIFGVFTESLLEAEYQGRKVTLNKPMQGDVKKFKVYVKDPKTGNVKKVNFGDPDMRIKKSNPERRKSFRARHNCDNPGPKTKARYWSCRKW